MKNEPMSSKLFRSGEIQGKMVIDTAGNRLGKAKEVAFSLDGGTVLVIEKEDGSEAQVQTARLVAIGEFVVAKPGQPEAPARGVTPVSQQAPQTTTVPPPAQLCRNCGSPLKPGARFCTRCGASAV